MSKRLTPKERIFAVNFAMTHDRAYSARIAGYSSPHQSAAQNLANADVADEIRRIARRRLQTEGAEVGVRVLIEVATDKLQKGSARVAAAKALVQASGVASVQSLSEADLAEMPPDKIRELLGQAQRQLEARMVTVSGRELPIEADSAQDAPQLPAQVSVFD